MCVHACACVYVSVCVTTRPECVWELSAPYFSYIVLGLLQTVNATKDARAIVGCRGEGVCECVSV